MKNILLITGGVVLTFLLIGSLIGVAVESGKQTQTVTKTVVTEAPKPEPVAPKPKPEDDKLSKTEREIFMDGCRDGSNETYCVCVVDYLDANYTTKQIYEIGDNASDDIPEDLLKAAAACI